MSEDQRLALNALMAAVFAPSDQTKPVNLEDLRDVLSAIKGQAAIGAPAVHLALYQHTCPACGHAEAVLLPKGWCCTQCATISQGERIVLRPKANRSVPTWLFTLDVRDAIRDGKRQQHE